MEAHDHLSLQDYLTHMISLSLQTVATLFSLQSIHTPWQCSSGHTEDWILVTAVGGRYVTRDAAALVQAKDQHLSAACTSLNLKKYLLLLKLYC